jgi:hypothetical protein
MGIERRDERQTVEAKREDRHCLSSPDTGLCGLHSDPHALEVHESLL